MAVTTVDLARNPFGDRLFAKKDGTALKVKFNDTEYTLVASGVNSNGAVDWEAEDRWLVFWTEGVDTLKGKRSTKPDPTSSGDWVDETP